MLPIPAAALASEVIRARLGGPTNEYAFANEYLYASDR
jgi:hypothetical protein